ncbi:MAG: site-specific integrase [Desulforhopalus sp.]|nr:site-specific integrase [Desulforhopalus sp.]
MATKERFKTNYPGVFFIEGKAVGRTGTEKIYYIRYRHDGKLTEEKAGRQYADDMTPARAAGLRAQRVEGKQLSNQGKRDEAVQLANKHNIAWLYSEYRKMLANPEKADDGRFRLYLQNGFGEKEPHELIQLDIDRVVRRLLKRLAPHTVSTAITLLKRTINYGVRRDLCKPLSFSIDLPKVVKKIDNKRNRYLSVEEAGTLLETLRRHSEQTYRMALVSLNTGMRFGEIASLRWQHIDIKSRTIKVMDPKNSENRMVFMTDAIFEMFEGLEKEKPDKLVFPSRVGGIQSDASHSFHRSVDELGLNDGIDDRRLKVVFHTLRHTAASWLVNQGITLPVIAKILGHKTLQMTERYSHVNDESVKKAMATFDQQQTKKDNEETKYKQYS